jgi:hypothetical protein
VFIEQITLLSVQSYMVIYEVLSAVMSQLIGGAPIK